MSHFATGVPALAAASIDPRRAPAVEQRAGRTGSELGTEWSTMSRVEAGPVGLGGSERVSLRALTAACLASTVVLGTTSPPAAAQVRDAAEFVVVVNAENPLDTIDPDALRRIFLKQSQRWPEGGEALPVDQSAASAVRESFSRSVLRQPQAAINAYWQRQILAGRANPPPVKATDAEVLAFVESDARAVGYVAAASPLPSGVKRLELSVPDGGDGETR